MGKVTMFNPQSGVTQDASRDAFDRQYSKEGWELVESAPEPRRGRSKASKATGRPEAAGAPEPERPED